jgi:hypothetical protein
MAKTIQEAIKEIESLDTIDRDDEKIEQILLGVDEDSYVLEEAGSFDSPGYDMWAYAIAYIEDAKPQLFTYMWESY